MNNENINIRKGLSIMIIAMAILLVIIGINNCNSPAVLAKPGTGDSIKTLHWKNRAGDSVTSIRGNPDLFAAPPRRLIDSLAYVYGVKEKFLLEYIISLQQSRVDIEPVQGSRATDYYPVDSGTNCPPAVKNMRQDFANPYYQVQAQVGDSSYLHLLAFDTLTAVWKKVKQGSIFNRRTLLQLDLSSANPYTRITGITAYRAPAAKPKRFGIGLQLGYGFQTGLTPKPYIGAGLSYNIIRL